MKDIKRLPNGNYEIKEEKLRELLENSESYLILMNGGLNHYDFYDDIMGDFDEEECVDDIIDCITDKFDDEE